MERYIEQLIEDFNEQIKSKNNSIEEIDEEEIKDDFDIAEEYVNGRQYTLSEITAIEIDKLPPDSRLSDLQIKLLFPKMKELLKKFNFELDYPCELPVRMKYKLLRNEWGKEEYVVLPYGESHIEFCTYMKEDCPLPEYCNYCDEFEDEMENMDSSIENDEDDPLGLVSTKEEVEHRKRKEKKDKIKNFKPPENHIPGIYNYCDRWCEKCNFTDRCSNFSLEKELDKEKNDDKADDDLWSDLHATFEAAIELIQEHAEKMGVDLNDISDEEKEKNTSEKDAIEHHRLYRLSLQYSKNIQKWLEENNDYINSKLDTFENSNSNNFKRLNDAIEILYWYMIFITAKVKRALSGLFSNFDDEIREFDLLGSAKIALIAMERSLGALAGVLDYCPEKQDSILDLLLELKRIKNLTEETFPDAWGFVRPGFDE